MLRRWKALKATDEPYPLHYAPDSFKYNMWAKICLNQIRKFKRFYWDTNGKQLKQKALPILLL